MKQILSLACLAALTLGVTRLALTSHAQQETVYFFTQGILSIEQMQYIQAQLERVEGVQEVALHDNDRAFKVTLRPRRVSGKTIRSFITCAQVQRRAIDSCPLPTA